MKGRISKEWAKLWVKAMGPKLAITRKRAMIKALCNHSYRFWIFCNNEDHQKNNCAVAEYKQKDPDDKISQLYSSFECNDIPLTIFQLSHFDIQQDQLLILL
jgi:hypothetical protein